MTDVRIARTEPEEEVLKAFVAITLGDCFVVRGLKVIHGANGLFVAMPARRKPDGTFQDIFHPISPQAREALERVVLDAYLGETDDPGTAGVGARLRPPPFDLTGGLAHNPRTA